jgi:hypothetical protein
MCIVWIIMMHTMKNKMNTLTPIGTGIKVKNEAMQEILGQRPS